MGIAIDWGQKGGLWRMRMQRRTRFVTAPLAALVLIVFAMMLAPAAAGATEDGVIEGRIVDGTIPSRSVGVVDVRLYASDGQSELPERTTKTDANGNYRFVGLPRGENYVYLVASRRDGIWYNTGRIGLAKTPTQKVDLTVYAAGPDDSKVRIKSASLMMMQVDKVTQNISVLETFMFVNPTKRTYQPTTEGPKGPMGLLRFSIPTDATNIRPMGELSSREVIQNDKGFATDLPIRPGETEVTFSYLIPYRQKDGTYAFDRTMPYPIDQFRLLSPADGPDLRASGLKPEESAPLWGDAYKVLGATKLPARWKTSVSLSGLPVNTYALSTDNRSLWAAAAGALLLLFTLSLLIWRRIVRSGAVAPGSASDEQEQLITALAELDSQYESGALEDEPYRRERELRKRRLISVMAQGPQLQDR